LFSKQNGNILLYDACMLIDTLYKQPVYKQLSALNIVSISNYFKIEENNCIQK